MSGAEPREELAATHPPRRKAQHRAQLVAERSFYWLATWLIGPGIQSHRLRTPRTREGTKLIEEIWTQSATISPRAREAPSERGGISSWSTPSHQGAPSTENMLVARHPRPPPAQELPSPHHVTPPPPETPGRTGLSSPPIAPDPERVTARRSNKNQSRHKHRPHRRGPLRQNGHGRAASPPPTVSIFPFLRRTRRGSKQSKYRRSGTPPRPILAPYYVVRGSTHDTPTVLLAHMRDSRSRGTEKQMLHDSRTLAPHRPNTPREGSMNLLNRRRTRRVNSQGSTDGKTAVCSKD